uniref:Uncharacterized protein n=1 Tax=Chlorella vulgaris TaxID=3077 RepID=V9H0Y3_CHLVU|nr:hypothetical protein ChvulCp056 [Chlorella vulgaris]pir/T07243/ hypothetical protein 61 - Chlorella vulgaris chloroplast [Chlorella vulgaris]QSV10857.1 hypothetical protein [Chlorella vulgaris]BAA57890.1 unnamed protein product [Chlorella vulgaris]
MKRYEKKEKTDLHHSKQCWKLTRKSKRLCPLKLKSLLVIYLLAVDKKAREASFCIKLQYLL